MAQLSVVITTDDRVFGTAVTSLVRSSGVPVSILEPASDSDQTPDVAVVDIRTEGPAQSKVEHIRTQWPSAGIVAVASVAEPERILQAMRAGANEFFVWPAGSSGVPDSMQEGIREAIKKTSTRLQAAAQVGNDPSRVLAFFGTKGGVGTTTLAVNCATELARLSKRPTLIVDLNPFIGEVGLFLGVRPRFTVVDALDSVDRLDTVFLKKLVATHKSGLDIMAGSELVDRPSARDSERMQELFGVLKQSYPYIVLDAGGLTNPSASTALFASDASFLVANPDVASIRNTRRMVDRMRKMGAGPERVRLLLNRTSDNPAFAPDEIEEVVGRPVDQSFPSDYRTVSEALNSGVPLTTTNNTELAAEFGRFMRKLAGLKTPGTKESQRRPGQLLGLF